MEFSYWAGGGRDLNSFGGADGILCTFADKPGLGASGMDIGFVGGESYAVEIDSYSNSGNDPAGEHFGIVYQSIRNHLETYSSDCTDDSQWHHMGINYYDGTMKVLLDDRVIMEADDIQLKDRIYLGFTAATGSGCNLQKIKDIFISYGEKYINYVPERPSETPLDFIGTSYTFIGKKSIELKAVYIGCAPENAEVEVDDPSAFDHLLIDWTGTMTTGRIKEQKNMQLQCMRMH